MYVLITYDVADTATDGAGRLRRVAKLCTQYGQRVQFSVFECLLEPAQFEQLKHDLLDVIDIERDSIRFYNLGSNWKRRVEHFGAKEGYDPQGFLMV
ncbi:CRISPR-associated endonuclease Cas2 [Enorma phocaeensis]|uniref:CRISPR-associated endonuclease Cas2 n=1 Tax=Enorma phocaeensis TaxID=1871019 RepID=UPI003209F5BF